MTAVAHPVRVPWHYPLLILWTFKKSNLIQYSPKALKKLSDTLQLLAEAEGLSANAEAIRIRIEGERGLGNTEENREL